MGVQLIRVEKAGDDRLVIIGRSDDGSEIVATGWVSAMENHHPPENYASMVQKAYSEPEEGDTSEEWRVVWEEVPPDTPNSEIHILPDAESRPMTDEERRIYWQQLLDNELKIRSGDDNVLYQLEEPNDSESTSSGSQG